MTNLSFITNILLITSLFFMPNALALNCYITANKNPAWNFYNVDIQMFEYGSKDNQVLLTFSFPKLGKTNSLKKPFDCAKVHKFYFKATYTPAIWYDEKGLPINNTFTSKQVFNISAQYMQLKANAKESLNITVSFPENFPLTESPETLLPAN